MTSQKQVGLGFLKAHAKNENHAPPFRQTIATILLLKPNAALK